LLKHRYHKRIYLEDEMRGGTRTECKQRWAAEGSRPVCKVKLGYEFTYLYAAINPATGKLIALLLPDMTKASFGLFMEHFRVETKAVHGHHKVVMVADGAGSHQHQVCERYGVAFQKLPRGCPELNPVERFFEQLRKELSNQVFTSIRKVENRLCRILKNYFDHPQTLVQLCHFPYIRNA
jgi:transposase